MTSEIRNFSNSARDTIHKRTPKIIFGLLIIMGTYSATSYASQKWFEVLIPIFGIVTVSKLSVVISRTAANEDQAYCDYFNTNAEEDYDQAMWENEFVRTTCCQFSNHEEHPSCSSNPL